MQICLCEQQCAGPEHFDPQTDTDTGWVPILVLNWGGFWGEDTVESAADEVNTDGCCWRPSW